MVVHKEPTLGKMGVFSQVSKSFVFGICCDSKKECLEELGNHIGFYDKLKYRWSCKAWTEIAIFEWKEQRKEHEEFINERKKQIEQMKINEKFIRDNLHKLTEKQQEKYLPCNLPLNFHNHKSSMHLFKEILAGRAYKDKS
jgi:hypothetical protein